MFDNPYNPLGLDFFGLKVIQSEDRPRYVLPKEVIPGVPWPPGFREKINTWSTEFLGTTNMLPKGAVFILANQYVIMRPRDVVKISNLI